jgi:hypothetical protein
VNGVYVQTVFPDSITEPNTATDTFNAVALVPVTLSEAANATDAVDCTVTWQTSITEVNDAQDLALGGNASTSAILENSDLTDAVSASALIPVAVSEPLTATDAVSSNVIFFDTEYTWTDFMDMRLVNGGFIDAKFESMTLPTTGTRSVQSLGSISFAPSSGTIFLKSILFLPASQATIWVHLVPSGGQPDLTNRIYRVSVAQGSSFMFDLKYPLMLTSSFSLYIVSSTSDLASTFLCNGLGITTAFDQTLAKWMTGVELNSGTYTTNTVTVGVSFFNQLKTRSYYSKILYLLPHLGGNFAGMCVPLIDTNAVGNAVNSGSSNFTDSDYSEANGLNGDGSSKQINLHVQPTFLMGLGLWMNTLAYTGTDSVPMGTDDPSDNPRLQLDLRSGLEVFTWGPPGTAGTGVAVAASATHYYGQRTSSVVSRLYRKGQLLATNTTAQSFTPSGSVPTIRLLGYLFNGTRYYFTARSIVAYITNGQFSDYEAAEMHSLINRYLMTPLGRASVDTEVATWASAVASAGGTLTSNSLLIADTLIAQLKTRSYASKVVYLLPLLGGNLNAARVPLRDSLNVGIAGNINCVDADFSESTGLQGNGTNKALDTLIRANQLGSGNNGGLGYWENNYTGASNFELMGSYDSAGSNAYLLYADSAGSPRQLFCWGLFANYAVQASNGSSGHYYGQRTSTSDRRLYKNGSQIAVNSTNDTAVSGISDATIRVLGSGGHFLNYSSGRCAVAYMTDGTMSGADITDFHALLNTYLIGPTGR